jgi:Ca-activated chloride channel homolog
MNLFFSRPLFLASLLTLIPLVYYWRRLPTSLTPRRKRDTLCLRVLTVICLSLALSGTQIVSQSDHMTVLFLLDRSLSTGGDSQGWQRTYISESLAQRGKEDQFGVILFGTDSGIEIPAGTHAQTELGQLTTVVDRKSTQLTSAMRFAATAFPGETARRLVVITDGRSTEPDCETETQALSDAGIEVWMVPLPTRKVKDIVLSRFESPAQTAVHEPFLLRAVVESQGLETCQLLITENGVPKQTLNLKLREGPNLFLLPQKKDIAGPVRYEARVLSDQDQLQQNNKGETLTLIGGEQTVLVLRAEDGPSPLVPLLDQAGIQVRTVQPSELPTAVGAWRDVSALVIEDVDSLNWSKRLQTIVSLLVREGGMGLMMCGSDSTFGVGAYQRTPIEPLLPVNLSIRRPKDQPLSALVQLLDKSGSMGGDPIRMAREAAIAAGETLSERDLLGVVGFDSAARWVVPLEAKGDGKALRQGVSTLRAGGGTDLYPAFDEALDKLENIEAPLKHIIVLSDGAVADGAYDKLLTRANAHRITVSAVAFGEGADIKFLEDLTKKGKGRLFRSEQTSEGSSLAQVFIRDTVLATGAGIQEKPVEARPTESGRTSPLLTGLKFDGTPKLLAHNMASSKGGTAQTLLHTPKKDPILATGRAGLGTTAAWLSDLGGDWAKGWDQTPGPTSDLSLLETLLLRTVRNVVSSSSLPLQARGNRLSVRSGGQGDLASLEVDLTTRQPLAGPVKIISIAKDGSSVEAILHPSGPFHARGTVKTTEPGSGLVLAQDSEGNLLGRTNFTVPLAPEFTRLGTDRSAIKRWTQVPNAEFDPKAQTVFKKPAQPVPTRTPLEQDLARGALLLLMLEIAVRRLPLPKFGQRRGNQPRQATQDTSSRLSRLRATKEAIRSRITTVSEAASPSPKPKIERLQRTAKKPTAPSRSEPPPKEVEEAAESTLARLKRTRKKKP